MTEETMEKEAARKEPAPEMASGSAKSLLVAGIKFRNRGKVYFFDPTDLSLSVGDKVVVETSKGLELGDVVRGSCLVDAGRVVQPLRRVVRIATEDDLRIEELCRKREREAYVIGKQKIAAHGLDMKLVDVECSFEGNKILFFFSSDGRVDFRELVKDLAGVFRTRIELRQIGVRDEARMLGGLGVCGRPFCCGSFMEDFAPVSTKMAKTQSMSLNPAKISGCCGRLMCCLRYEQPAYEELIKNVPKNGAFVETPDGYGNVTQVNVLRQTVKVKLDGPGEDSFRLYDADEVAAIPSGRPRDGSQPPHVLVLKPKKPKEPDPEDTGWELPAHLFVTEEQPGAENSGKQNASGRKGNRNRGRQQREGQDGAPKQQNRQKQRGQKSQGDRQKQQDAQQQKQSTQHKQPAQHKQNQNGAAKQERPAGERSGAHKNKNRGTRQGSGAKQAPENPTAGGENRPDTSGKRSGYYHRRHKPKNQSGGGTPKQEG